MSKASDLTLLEIMRRFSTEEAARAYFERIRWPNGPVCPHCGSAGQAYALTPNKEARIREGLYKCGECRDTFSVTVGTVMESSKVPLHKWLIAFYMMCASKTQVSALQLQRQLEIGSYRTALFLCHRIRYALKDVSASSPLGGIVEADETYVGGKPRKGNRRDDDTPGPRGRATKKVPVVGAVERGGRVVARVADDLTGKGLLRFLRSVADPKGSILITDELSAYNEAGAVFRRSVINHRRAYAEGQTHTNSIEGFWSLLKRAWYGSHHHYSKNYMALFVGEACWKYNQRRNTDPFATLMKGCFA